jgi:hypothetical protein
LNWYNQTPFIDDLQAFSLEEVRDAFRTARWVKLHVLRSFLMCDLQVSVTTTTLTRLQFGDAYFLRPWAYDRMQFRCPPDSWIFSLVPRAYHCRLIENHAFHETNFINSQELCFGNTATIHTVQWDQTLINRIYFRI